jgi:hypothetical protein
MNEDRLTLRLRDYMDHDDGWGHEEGHTVYDRLRAVIDRHPVERIIVISLEGVKRTDASFPRESVVNLARYLRPHRGVCLGGAMHQDLQDNWEAAALKREQPLFYWEGERPRILGPQPSEGLRDMLAYVLRVPVAVTSAAAAALGLKVPNASNKLKQLWESGYILRRERAAASGGTEYEYLKIG